MAQTAPITETRAFVQAALEAEFTPDELRVKPGRLHASHPGGFAGIYPMSESEGRNVLDQDSMVAVQVFLPWEAGRNIDARRVVDPTQIESYAERLRERIYTMTHPRLGTAGLWDARVTRVEYEADPTGQVTRFTAYVIGIGQNFAETTA